jgi:hypothetical protein
MRYDWQQKTKLRGYVDEKNYTEWVRLGCGEPKEYCGDVSGSNIIKVANNTLDNIMLADRNAPIPLREKGKQYYTQVQWAESYVEAVGKQFFKALADLAKLGAADKVRIVFWFDN